VRAAEELADADADFVARDHGNKELRAAPAERLRDRERGREHDRRRMQHRAVVQVILLGDVRCCGVGHRGDERLEPRRWISTLARSVGRAHLFGEAGNRFDRARAFAGERRAEPVDHQVFGAIEDLARDRFCVQRRGKCGELGAGVRFSHRRLRAPVKTGEML
jgi:hypothetical protein